MPKKPDGITPQQPAGPLPGHFSSPATDAGRRRILAILFLILPAACAQAADPDQPAADMLARVRAQAQKITTLSADFTSTKTVAFLTGPLRTSGRLVYTAQGRVCWEVRKPFQAAAVYAGQQAQRLAPGPDGRWTAQSGGPDPVLAETMRQLEAWITGAAFQESQTYAITVAPGPPLVLRLTPKHPGLRRFLASIEMTFAPALDAVRTLTLTEASGDQTRIIFDHVAVNGKIPEDVPGISLQPSR